MTLSKFPLTIFSGQLSHFALDFPEAFFFIIWSLLSMEEEDEECLEEDDDEEEEPLEEPEGKRAKVKEEALN